jgi:ATP-dependent Clp protease protease subunit
MNNFQYNVPGITSLADHHYYIFNTDFDPSSTGNAIGFIIERNLMENRPKQIKLIINSHGGEVPSMFALVDTMKGSKVPVHTYGLGTIASCGLMTFIAGEKGKRFLTRNTAILSHQSSWATYGKEHEMLSSNKQISIVSNNIMNHYKKCTGLSEKQIKEYLLPPNDVWLTPKEAIKLGIADEIIDFY